MYCISYNLYKCAESVSVSFTARGVLASKECEDEDGGMDEDQNGWRTGFEALRVSV